MSAITDQITWSRPNVILSIVDELDWSEKVLGTDSLGNNYVGVALVHLDKIEDIIDIEAIPRR